MVDDGDVHPLLAESAGDIAGSILRGLLGGLPGGSILSELTFRVLPGQRAERLAAFLTKTARLLDDVHDRLSDVESVVRALSAEQRALYVEGGEAAARAISNDRAEQFACLVVQGFVSTDKSVQAERLMVDLLAQLTESDISELLDRAVTRTWGDLKGQDIMSARAAAGPMPTEPTEIAAWSAKREEFAAMEGYRLHRLVRLGCLSEQWTMQPDRPRLGGGSVRQPDRHSGYRLTPVAVAILQRLSLLPPRGVAGKVVVR